MIGEWTTEWPKVPGWYWVWQPSKTEGKPGFRDPAHVFRAAGGRLFFNVLNEGARPDTHPDLLWGPRIDVPDAPDGTPGTRYALATLTAQTHTYLTDDERWTTVHAKARIFKNRDAARRATFGVDGYDWWVEPIDDIDEFRGRPDTW
jgi:hypothetical protein